MVEIKEKLKLNKNHSFIPNSPHIVPRISNSDLGHEMTVSTSIKAKVKNIGRIVWMPVNPHQKRKRRRFSGLLWPLRRVSIFSCGVNLKIHWNRSNCFVKCYYYNVSEVKVDLWCHLNSDNCFLSCHTSCVLTSHVASLNLNDVICTCDVFETRAKTMLINRSAMVMEYMIVEDEQWVLTRLWF